MVWILCLCVVLLSSCQQQPQERHYTEINIEAVQVAVPSVSAAADMLTWEIPTGWRQVAGEGMRVVTFQLISDAKAIDCSIVALGRMAGTLEANLRRWMGQIQLQASSQELKTLIDAAASVRIKSGQEAHIFDFTNLPSDQSMIVSMITMEDATVFVKMTGSVVLVKENKNGFLKLLGSISRR